MEAHEERPPLGGIRQRYVNSSLARLRRAFVGTAKTYAHHAFQAVFEDPMVAWNPDVVHAHDGMSLPLAAAVAQRSDARMIFDSHELEAHRNPPLSAAQKRSVEKIEQRYLSMADVVTTVGHKISEHLETRYAIARPEVIYNSPPQTPRPLPEKWRQPGRTSLRAEANQPRDAIVLVYTGNIAVNRGVEQTLAGMAHYLKRKDAVHGIRLSMVGKTRPDTFAAITALAENLGLQEHIHFHDPVSPTAVVDFIAEGDIAVIPVIPAAMSYDYAMPNKLFESMLAGLPILGAQLAEMAPFIEEHNLGVCYDPLSAEGFSEALAELLTSGKARRLSAARKQELAQRFGWESQEAVLRGIYRRLEPSGRALRVAMVVPNPCDPDYRVVKQAETLAAAGHMVRVFCTRPTGSDLPALECINAVEYRRLDWSLRVALDRFFKSQLRRLRVKQQKPLQNESV